MGTIQAQLKALRKLITIPYRIVYVDREVSSDEFEGKDDIRTYLDIGRYQWDSWDSVVDVVTSPFKTGGKIVSGVVGSITGNNDEAKKLMNEQMRAYKEQSELTRKELDAKRNEVEVQKRRIQEKQIRSLRRSYRSPGLLGTGQEAAPDMSSQLGG